MARLLRPVTRMISSSPEATASSTTYWIVGLSTSGSISLGWAFVAGRNRVPSPAAGNTAFLTFMVRPSLGRDAQERADRFEQVHGDARSSSGPRTWILSF